MASRSMEMIREFERSTTSCSSQYELAGDIIGQMVEEVGHHGEGPSDALVEFGSEVVDPMVRAGCLSKQQEERAGEILNKVEDLRNREAGKGVIEDALRELVDVVGPHEFDVFCEIAPGSRELQRSIERYINNQPGTPVTATSVEDDDPGMCVILERGEGN